MTAFRLLCLLSTGISIWGLVLESKPMVVAGVVLLAVALYLRPDHLRGGGDRK